MLEIRAAQLRANRREFAGARVNRIWCRVGNSPRKQNTRAGGNFVRISVGRRKFAGAVRQLGGAERAEIRDEQAEIRDEQAEFPRIRRCVPKNNEKAEIRTKFVPSRRKFARITGIWRKIRTRRRKFARIFGIWRKFFEPERAEIRVEQAEFRVERAEIRGMPFCGPAATLELQCDKPRNPAQAAIYLVWLAMLQAKNLHTMWAFL